MNFKLSSDSQEWKPIGRTVSSIILQELHGVSASPRMFWERLGPTSAGSQFSGWGWGGSFVSQQDTGNGGIEGKGLKMTPNPECGTEQQPWPSAGYSSSPQQVLFSLHPSLGHYLLVKSSDMRVWLLTGLWVVLPGWGELLENQGWDPWEWDNSTPSCSLWC